MGISCLSIIEIIYYFTLRLFIRQHHQRKSMRIQIHQIDPLDQSIPNIVVDESSANTSTEDKKDHQN